MKLKYLNQIEQATGPGRMELFRFGTAMLFIVAIMVVSSGMMPDNSNGVLLVAAAVIGGYMALNIGANDVANNVGPAVGSKALTIFWAIIIAAIFESAGAIIAGGDVVSTVKKGIIDPALIGDSDQFIWLMMGALLAASIWLNLATYVGAPVSTTHSIVGGVLGAGIAAGGVGVADWGQLATIASSWVISPVIGGFIAALTLYIIKRTITYQSDKLAAAARMVPFFMAIMGWAFSTYLILKGLKQIIKLDFITAALIGLLIAGVIYLISKILIAKRCTELENDKTSVSSLFTIPLIFSAALLSFAHGANDVANAVGPLAAINDAVFTATITSKAEIPLWVMLIGAVGISLGLALYGPKLIRVVGSEITELNQMRAFCVALAAAVTVIIASQLGLPVSSTHVAVGAVFGVGFLREAIKSNYMTIVEDIRMHHAQNDDGGAVLEQFLLEFEGADFDRKDQMIKTLKQNSMAAGLSKAERKKLRKQHKKQLVRRSAVYKIAAAWVITVPASGILAAIFYFTIKGMMI
ncbi:MAG: Probable low-affinity inorganic phosphate transporter [uncultured Thiotrichaceae bacterium]|uniref:Phosphate transporter n=1 Tax=uncultured Thiotrichaceae bacterium TaxID=298394 RepID=A0A6S6S5A9_9GAMM|nr:MAG: Probable low-affinity inorganic phosphate transporter [uncultured Thiotrichaceae bacterium]